MLYRTLLKVWFLPPLFNILLIVGGLLLMRRYRKLGWACSLLGMVSLLLLSTPQVANSLLRAIEVEAISPERVVEQQAGAIVVLGAGHKEIAPEYGDAMPNPDGVERLIYAAYLHRATGLPLLLTGGQPSYSQYIHADVMADYLQGQHDITPTWLEVESRTTWENAKYSKKILQQQGINRVALVTQSSHMCRSVMLFEAAGFEVIPAPTAMSFSSRPVFELWRWIPSAEYLNKSSKVIHEVLGLIWYRLNPPESPS